jgi:MFS family permease
VTQTPSPETHGEVRPGLWYGWVILGTVFVVMLTLIGTRTSFGVFFKGLSAEFGWSRAETSGAFSMGMLGFAFSAPFVGWILDKWSIRWTMALGVSLFGAGMLMGFFVSALWHIYLMYFILSLGFGGATHLPQIQVLSNWFVRRRGLALGLTSSAQGIAFTTSALTSALIAGLGWRLTYLVFGCVILLGTLPLAALLLRDRPQEKGTVADAPFLGAEDLGPEDPGALSAAESSAHGEDAAQGGFPADLIFSIRFFLLLGLFAAIAYNYTTLVVHLVPLATDSGFSPAEGAAIFTLFGVSVFAGNLASSISDKYGRTSTYITGAMLGAGAMLLLAGIAGAAAGTQIVLGAGLSGFALGLVRPTIVAMLTDHFAGPGIGRVNGTMMMLFALTGAGGPLATGYLFDRFGGYLEAMLLIAGVFLLSCLFAAALGRMKPLREEET